MKDFYELEDKITASLSGCGIQFPEHSVREVFETISRTLLAQGEASIEAIGSFRRRDEADNSRISFIPSRSFRRQLAASGSDASSVVFGNTASLSAETECENAVCTPVEKATDAEHASDEIFEEETTVVEATPVTVEADSLSGTVIDAMDVKQDSPSSSVFMRDTENGSSVVSNTRRFVLIVAGLVAFAIFLYCILYLKAGDRYKEPNRQSIERLGSSLPASGMTETTSNVALDDLPGALSDTVFYDTEIIQEGSNLPDIARKHYGHACYWVYIFLANSDQLSRPTSLPLGRTLRIPRLEDSGIDVADPVAVREALHKAVVLLEGKPSEHRIRKE